jgi:hypothetical protein
MHFKIWDAARFFVNRKIASAWLTSLPRIISTTSRAFCADPRKYLALAVASISDFLYLAGGADATLLAFSTFVPEWPLNVRVGANSPSLWPTMFSVT